MSNHQVTIITPIAPHHRDLFVRCADSVRNQSVDCRHLHMVDINRKGPAYIRNLLLKQVKTPFVVFLDADDYLEPDFVYECLLASTPTNYVYTNWYQGSEEKETPDGAFWETSWHLVTCLLHTSMVRGLGGFDEELPVMEDTDLFLRFGQHAYCGTKVKKPLVHYTNDGHRSKEGRESGEQTKVKAELTRRFAAMGCCGKNIEPDLTPIGQRAAGDVQVRLLWRGNRVVTGLLTKRRYGRGASPRLMWMNPVDAKARPDLYLIVPPPAKTPVVKAERKAPVTEKETAPKKPKTRTFADMLKEQGRLKVAQDAPLPAIATSLNPNYAKLFDITQRIINHD